LTFTELYFNFKISGTLFSTKSRNIDNYLVYFKVQGISNFHGTQKSKTFKTVHYV